MQTIKSILEQAIAQLTKAGVESPRLDAELLLAHILEKTRGWLWAYHETGISEADKNTFFSLISRRIHREPLAYILGEWEFYGRTFHIASGVLVPRPETELLVEAVINWSKTHSAQQIVDVGTGSGAIVITLALELPDVSLWAIDISPQALHIAQQNITNYRLSHRVTLLEGDLITPLHGHVTLPVDVVVANLPYIPLQEIPHLMPEVRDYEPRVALAAAEEGLALIYRLIDESPSVLRNGGLLALEIGINQADSTVTYLKERQWTNISIVHDYAGIPRHILAEYYQ
ncbi:MAG TPA: peptide chain release factor N(5)-glutamine methyltransferase [Armatimonadota bacterium]|nr:peptide chain release factor N(5)-glutamine methyltransferase [Armatimonadota bacterium]